MRPYDPESMMVPGPVHRALAQGLELRTWADQRAVDSAYALAQHLANLTAQGVKLGGLCAVTLGRDVGVSEEVAAAALTLNGGRVSSICGLRLPPEVIAGLRYL